jgi:hypothetical protein
MMPEDRLAPDPRFITISKRTGLPRDAINDTWSAFIEFSNQLVAIAERHGIEEDDIDTILTAFLQGGLFSDPPPNVAVAGHA